jgi:hypothetical protein
VSKGYLLNRQAGVSRMPDTNRSLEDVLSSLRLTSTTTWKAQLILRQADMLFETNVHQAQTGLQLTASIFATLGTLLSAWKTVFKLAETPINNVFRFCSRRRQFGRGDTGSLEGSVEMEPLARILKSSKVEENLTRELAELRARFNTDYTIRMEKEAAMMQTIEQLQRAVAGLTADGRESVIRGASPLTH